MTFKEWLDKKNMFAEDFATSVGLRKNTVAKWSADETRVPRGPYMDIVAKKYPDCPLLKR